jgi:hypothetical protein
MIDLGSILALAALIILVGLFVSQPLIAQRSVSVSQDEQAYSALMAERDRILDALQELDADHAMGKIPADAYPIQRNALLHRGAEMLRRLESFDAQAHSGGEGLRLAEAVAAGQKEEVPMTAPNLQNASDEEIENLLTARRRALNGKATGFCHHCGHPIHESDQFCAKCGAILVSV